MKLVLYSVLCLVLVSCQKELPDTTAQTTDTPILSIKFNCEGMEVINSATRALSPSQERSIKDLNIYLFHRTMGIVKHEYVTSANSVSLNLSRGEYDVYAIANYGSNMGNHSINEVENFEVSINNESDLESNSALIMSGYHRVNVTANSNLSIELHRIVAKIDVSINVVPDFNFTLHSVRVVNPPQNCSVHNGNSASNLLSYDEHTSSSLSFYMFENLQGENNSIATEQQKNKDTAPSGATYLHIIGLSDNKKVEYSIYLGENNTTDFNVYRNKNYTYSINIKGINEVDTRVNIAILQLSPLNDNYNIGDVATSTLKLSCTDNRSNKYWITYNREEGDGTLSMDDVVVSWGTFYPFLDYGVNEKSAILKYTQNSVSKVKIRATVKDANNFTFSNIIATDYIENPFTVDLVTSTDSKGGSEAIVQFKADKKNYNGKVEMKCELLSGAGTILYQNTPLENNQYISSSFDIATLKFIPSKVTDAKIKVTFKIESGETASTGMLIKVSKRTIQVKVATSEKLGANFDTYLVYIDGATTHGGVLPLNSCKELKIGRRVAWRCSSCSLFSNKLGGAASFDPSFKSVSEIVVSYKPNSTLNTEELWWHSRNQSTSVSYATSGRCVGFRPTCYSKNFHLGCNEHRIEVVEPSIFFQFILP